MKSKNIFEESARVHRRKEANFQTTFNHFLKSKLKHIFVFKIPDVGYQNPFDVFSVDKYGHFHAWELKQTQTDSIPFSAVVDHQVTALEIVSGMVVIKYPKGVSIIPIDIFVDEKKRSDRKSLRWERAKELSTLIFDSKIRKE